MFHKVIQIQVLFSGVLEYSAEFVFSSVMEYSLKIYKQSRTFW